MAKRASSPLRKQVRKKTIENKIDRLTNTRALRRRPGIHVDVAMDLDGEEHGVNSLRKTISLAIRERVILVEPDGLLEKRTE